MRYSTQPSYMFLRNTDVPAARLNRRNVVDAIPYKAACHVILNGVKDLLWFAQSCRGGVLCPQNNIPFILIVADATFCQFDYALSF